MNKGEMSAYRLKRQCLLAACKRLRKDHKAKRTDFFMAGLGLRGAQQELAAMRRRYYAPEPDACVISLEDWIEFRRS